MEERKKKRFSALSLIRIIALVVALVSAGAILWQLYIYRQGEETYEELRQQYTTTAEESAQSQAYKQAEEPFQLLDVDFEALQAQNPDVVGWIDFDAIELSYPVVWSGDNEKYLRTMWNGTPNTAGSVFLECANTGWQDLHVILYGHNMRDGSRFGTLNPFEKTEHIEEYPIFQLAERYETVDYMPFAVFHTSVDAADESFYPYDQIDFADENGFNRYVRDVKERSILDLPVEVAYGDRLLTLVTCHSGIDRGRLVIVCREVKPEDGLS